MRKLEKLRYLLKEKEADCIILHWSDPNHNWFLEEEVEGSFVVIEADKVMLLKTPLETYSKKGVEIINVKSKEEIKKIFGKYEKVLLNFTNITLSQRNLFDKAKLADITRDMDEIRSKKEIDEIVKIRRACKHTDKCFELLIEKIPGFNTEKEAERFIKTYALENELELSFSPIIASGKNASKPHHKPESNLHKGFCVIDFGFKYKGYCSDMTRTIYIGSPSEEEEKIYEKILGVQENAIRRAIVGAKTDYLDKTVRKELGVLADLFNHSLGHGLGVEVHEAPSFKNSNLKENMIITIEPGVYKENSYGIRIEDDVIVKEKPEVLTKSPKELVIIGN